MQLLAFLLKHVAVCQSHPPAKSIELHLPRFRFLISLLAPPSKAIALMERAATQLRFGNAMPPRRPRSDPSLDLWQANFSL